MPDGIEHIKILTGKIGLDGSDIAILASVNNESAALSLRHCLDEMQIANSIVVIGPIETLTAWLKSHNGGLKRLLLAIPPAHDGPELLQSLDRLADEVNEDTHVYGFGTKIPSKFEQTLRALGFEDCYSDLPHEDIIRKCLELPDAGFPSGDDLTIAVMGLAGGVGASMFCVNLAQQIARSTKRHVVILDAQMPERSISMLLGMSKTSEDSVFQNHRKRELAERLELIEFHHHDEARIEKPVDPTDIMSCIDIQLQNRRIVLLDCSLSSIMPVVLQRCNHCIFVGEPDVKCQNALTKHVNMCMQIEGPKTLHIVLNKLGKNSQFELMGKDFISEHTSEPIESYQYSIADFNIALASRYPSIPMSCLKDRHAYKKLLTALGLVQNDRGQRQSWFERLLKNLTRRQT